MAQMPMEFDEISDIYYALPYSSSSGGYVCPANGLYLFRARSSVAGTDISVIIKKNGVSNVVTTVKQPSNTNIFAPMVLLSCSADDVLTSGNASSYSAYKLCENTNESIS